MKEKDKIEEWFKKNTFECPLGRVSLKQCTLLRERPKVCDKIFIKDPKEYGVYMPKVCESCTIWKKFTRN